MDNPNVILFIVGTVLAACIIYEIYTLVTKKRPQKTPEEIKKERKVKIKKKIIKMKMKMKILQ